jgi:hypothetical protein
MVRTHVQHWIMARRQRLLSSFAAGALLFCVAVLLLEAGCQSEASGTNPPAAQATASTTPPVVQAQPAQPPAPEKPAPPAPPVIESRPAQPAPVTQPQPQPQSQPQLQPQLAQGTPKIEFKATAQNFGDIGPETTHTTKFEFKNSGNAPLKVVHVKGCCGSVVRGVRDGQEYAPGESGALEVEYRTGTYPGSLVRRITMETNDPSLSGGVVDLTIRANVVYRIEHSPNRLNLFPRKENAGCAAITIRSTDGKPFSISGFRATAGTLTAAFDPNVKATEFVLQPKADTERLTRNPKGQISIALTHPECSRVDIPYDVLPEFSLAPSQLTLFNVKANEPIQREVWILSNYNEDFDIESVSSQRGAMKVLETRKVPGVAKVAGATGDTERTGARYQVKIEITPPAMDDKRSILSDVLEIKLKGGETLTVQCRGFYAAR